MRIKSKKNEIKFLGTKLKEKKNQERIKNNNNQKNKYHIWYKKIKWKGIKLEKKNLKKNSIQTKTNQKKKEHNCKTK